MKSFPVFVLMVVLGYRFFSAAAVYRARRPTAEGMASAAGAAGKS